MSIEATCPCGARFLAIPQLAGKVVNCPTCGQPFQVPKPVSATVSVACPCGKVYQVKRSMAGKRVQCTACQGQFIIPAALAGNASGTAPAASRPQPVSAARTSLPPAPSYGGPLDNLGDLSSLTDPLSAPLPAYNPLGSPTLPNYLPAYAPAQTKRKARKPISKSVLVGAGLSVLVVAAITAIGVATYVWFPFNLRFGLGFGYSTPEAAFAALKQAQIDRDWGALYSVMTPESQEKLVGLLAFVAQMAQGKDPDLTAIGQKHGLQSGPEPITPKSPQEFANFAQLAQENMQQAAQQISDRKGFFVEMMKFAEKKGEQAGAKFGTEAFTKSAAEMELVDVKIDGDTARGMQTSSKSGRYRSPVEFRRVNGGWLVHMPDQVFF